MAAHGIEPGSGGLDGGGDFSDAERGHEPAYVEPLGPDVGRVGFGIESNATAPHDVAGRSPQIEVGAIFTTVDFGVPFDGESGHLDTRG